MRGAVVLTLVILGAALIGMIGIGLNWAVHKAITARTAYYRRKIAELDADAVGLPDDNN